MVHRKKVNLSLVIRISKESRLQALFIFFWIYDSIIMSGVNFIAGYIGLSAYTYILCGVLTAVVVIYAIPAILHCIRYRHIAMYLLVIFGYVMTFFIFPENAKWLKNNFFEFIFVILPLIFLGFVFNKIKIPYRALLICSRVIIVFMLFIFLFYSGAQSDQSMGRAYTVLPSVMFVTHNMISKWNIWDVLATIAGGIFLLMCATRGPILLYLIFVLLELSLMSEKHRKLYIVLIAVVLILGLSPLGIVLAEKLMGLFEEAGFNVRIFEYFLSGNIMDDNGRNTLTENVFEMINRHPLIGNGIYSDRLATSSIAWVGVDGSYVHNIIYELWCDFGYIIGSILLVLFVWGIIQSWKNNRENNFRVIFLILLLVYVGRLLMSSSYLELPGFWVCVGVCFECSRRKKDLG